MADPTTAEIPLNVDAGSVGLLIRASTASAYSWVSVELFDPEGELIACSGCGHTPGVGERKLGRGTVQIPSTDRPGGDLVPGLYSFRVRVHPDPSPPGIVVDVDAAIRTETGIPFDRLLDLNFIYLPGSTLSAEIASSSELFATFLVRLDAWLAPLGIRAGRITHVDLDRPEFSRITSFQHAEEMFATTSSDVGRSRALNIYCLDAFDEPLAPAVGISGGAPGPLENGTEDSGIALRMSPFFECNDCTDAFADLVAHEIGHYLGLHHTTEAHLLHADPLSDTPRCPTETGSLWDCPDRPYVMFPLIGPSSTDWSASQRRIAQGHPLVRKVPAAIIREAAESPPDHSRALAAQPSPFRNSVVLEVGGTSRFGTSPLPLQIFDVRGRRVRTLRGARTLTWDGADENGRAVAPGVYFVRVAGDDRQRSSMMIRIVKID